MIDPVTIALVGCNLASLIAAGITSERARVWKEKALTASRFHMNGVVELGSANDKIAALESKLALAHAELSAARGMLLRFDASNRPRAERGRFGPKAAA